jgi:methyl-galactoside transport system ATP-binding protein
MNVDPHTDHAFTMSVSQRQMVEIAKAVSYNAKIIVLDEPTSSLTENEVKKLFSIVKDLERKRRLFVYISHKMDEVFLVCDEVAVLRDGKMILTKNTKETGMNELISAMVGRSLEKRFPDVDNTPGDYIFEVKGLTTKYEPILEGYFLQGPQRRDIRTVRPRRCRTFSELLEALFGVRTICFRRNHSITARNCISGTAVMQWT